MVNDYPLMLVVDSFQKKLADEARDFYEQLVTQFPNAGRYWKAYIEHEVQSPTTN